MYFSSGSCPWKIELMILMISEMFWRSALVIPVSSWATIYHKRITCELIMQFCTNKISQHKVTVMLQFHIDGFGLFHELNLKFSLEKLHHLFQQKWWLFIQDGFNCVLDQFDKWCLSLFHHLRHMWILRLTFLWCHHCHALNYHGLLRYAIVVLTALEKILYLWCQWLLFR